MLYFLLQEMKMVEIEIFEISIFNSTFLIVQE